MSATAEKQEATAEAVTGAEVSHMVWEWEYPVTFCGVVTSQPYRETPSTPDLCAVCVAQAVAWGVAP
jgi:hypothetical protein